MTILGQQEYFFPLLPARLIDHEERSRKALQVVQVTHVAWLVRTPFLVVLFI